MEKLKFWMELRDENRKPLLCKSVVPLSAESEGSVTFSSNFSISPTHPFIVNCARCRIYARRTTSKKTEFGQSSRRQKLHLVAEVAVPQPGDRDFSDQLPDQLPLTDANSSGGDGVPLQNTYLGDMNGSLQPPESALLPSALVHALSPLGHYEAAAFPGGVGPVQNDYEDALSPSIAQTQPASTNYPTLNFWSSAPGTLQCPPCASRPITREYVDDAFHPCITMDVLAPMALSSWLIPSHEVSEDLFDVDPDDCAFHTPPGQISGGVPGAAEPPSAFHTPPGQISGGVPGAAEPRDCVAAHPAPAARCLRHDVSGITQPTLKALRVHLPRSLVETRLPY